MKHRVSIIVPSLGRPGSVVRLIGALGKQTEKDFVLIVVEQRDDHGAEFADTAKKSGVEFVYRHLETANAPSARNAGVSLAVTDLVFFLDDDSLPDPAWLSSMAKNFDDPHIAGVVGRVLTPGQKEEPDRRDTGRLRIDGSTTDGFSSKIRQIGIDAAIGCNMGFRRSAVNEIGGFDTRYEFHDIRGDSDLSVRMARAGKTIVFDPDALVTHMRDPSGGGRKGDVRLKWYYYLFSNETYFFLKFLPHICFPLLVFRLLPWALRCMFGFGREVSVRSMLVPFRGTVEGMRKYNAYRYEHRS